MKTTHIVDISHYQPDPDFSKAKSAGLVGVFHKATQGTSYVDPTYAQRKKAAAQAGLPLATYHFLEAGNIDRQISHYLATVKPVPGERVVIDHEQNASIDEVQHAVQLLFNDPRNLQVTIYSGHTIKDQLGKTHDGLLAKTALWLPQYTSAEKPTWPMDTWPVWSLWQYTDKGTYPGFVGNVDCNMFNGGAAACARWMGPAGPG